MIYDRHPICPACNAVERNAWELDFSGGAEAIEHTCGSCGKEYRVAIHVRVNYTSTAIERPTAVVLQLVPTVERRAEDREKKVLCWDDVA